MQHPTVPGTQRSARARQAVGAAVARGHSTGGRSLISAAQDAFPKATPGHHVSCSSSHLSSPPAARRSVAALALVAHLTRMEWTMTEYCGLRILIVLGRPT